MYTDCFCKNNVPISPTYSKRVYISKSQQLFIEPEGLTSIRNLHLEQDILLISLSSKSKIVYAHRCWGCSIAVDAAMYLIAVVALGGSHPIFAISPLAGLIFFPNDVPDPLFFIRTGAETGGTIGH